MLDQIKELPIQDVAAVLGLKVNKTGTRMQSPHKDGKGTYDCGIKKNHWFCFVTSTHGTSIDLWMTYNSIPNNAEGFARAYAEMCNEFNIPMDTNFEASREKRDARVKWLNMLKDIAKYYADCLFNNPVAFEYADSRGINAETASLFGIGYSDGKTAQNMSVEYQDMLPLFFEKDTKERYSKDVFNGRLMFPIKNAWGDVMGFSGRRIDSAKEMKYRHLKNNDFFKISDYLFGLHESRQSIRKTGSAMLVEGIIDCLATYDMDLNPCCTFGKKLSEYQAELLAIVGAKKITIFYDNDIAGQGAIVETAKTILRHDMLPYIAFIDAEGMDPADWVRSGGQKNELQVVDALTFLPKKWFDEAGSDLGKRFDAILSAIELLSSISDATKRNYYASEFVLLYNIDKEILLPYLHNVIDNKKSTNKRAKKEKTKSSEETNEFSYSENICVVDNKIYIKKRSNFVEVANFNMEVLYWIEGEKGARIIKITPAKGKEITLMMNADALNSRSAFSKKLEINTPNCVFSGTVDDLSIIKRTIYDENTKKAILLPNCGVIAEYDIFLFENGIYDIVSKKFLELNKERIITIGENCFYVPKMETPQGINYKKSNLLLKDWYPKFISAYPNNAKIGFLHLAATIHCDIIYDVTKTFPLLYLYGRPGTGKDSFADILKSFFGNPIKGFALGAGSTSAAMMRWVAKNHNMYAHYNEYKERLSTNVSEAFKSMFDRVGKENAKHDNTEETWGTKVRAAVMISGEHIPMSNAALLTRCIIETFTLEGMANTRESFQALSALQKENAYTGMMCELLNLRGIFKRDFKVEYQNAKKEFIAFLDNYNLVKNSNLTLIERLISNAAILIATARITDNIMNGTQSWLLPDLVYTICNSTVEINSYQASAQQDDIFWNELPILMRGKTPILIDGIDYKIINGKIILFFQSVVGKFNANRLKQGASIFEPTMLLTYIKANTSYLQTHVVKKDGKSSRENAWSIKGLLESYGVDFSNIHTELGSDETDNEDVSYNLQDNYVYEKCY